MLTRVTFDCREVDSNRFTKKEIPSIVALTLVRAGFVTAAMVLTATSLALAETQATPVAQTSGPPAADFGSSAVGPDSDPL